MVCGRRTRVWPATGEYNVQNVLARLPAHAPVSTRPGLLCPAQRMFQVMANDAYVGGQPLSLR